jgi:prepilin-type N-terminal cleavage/methylation domain-containing protein
MKLNKKGFTLIEIITVVGIILILATGVMVYSNPNLQFTQARDSVRDSHVNILEGAFNTYKFEKMGSLDDLNLSEIPTDICNPNHSDPQDCSDFQELVEEGYISKLPTDPGIEAGEDSIGYKVELVNDGEVIIHADYEKRKQFNWPDDDGYIYNEGEYSYRFVEGKLVAEGETSVTQSKNDDYLLTAIFTEPDSLNKVEASWTTDLPIDLSKYNHIKIEHEVNEATQMSSREKANRNLYASSRLIAAVLPIDSVKFNFVTSDILDGGYNEGVNSDIQLTKDGGRLIETIDISDINSKQYVRIHGYGSQTGPGETTGDRQIKIYKVWFE